jgi:hypothetical protein
MVCTYSSNVEISHWVLESVTLLLSMEHRQSADEPVVRNLYTHTQTDRHKDRHVSVCVCVCVCLCAFVCECVYNLALGRAPHLLPRAEVFGLDELEFV